MDADDVDAEVNEDVDDDGDSVDDPKRKWQAQQKLEQTGV